VFLWTPLTSSDRKNLFLLPFINTVDKTQLHTQNDNSRSNKIQQSVFTHNSFGSRKEEEEEREAKTGLLHCGGKAASTSTQYIVLRGAQAARPSQTPSNSGTVPRDSDAEGTESKKRPLVSGETPPGVAPHLR